MERELLEEVVVEARAGRDAHAALAVEAEPDAQLRLGRRTDVAHAPPLRRLLAGEGGEQQIVVLAVVHGDADAVVVDAHDAAAREQPVGELLRLVDRDEQEAAVRRQRRVAERPQLCGEPFALLDRRAEVGRRRERGERERRGQRRDRRGRLARVELGRGLGRRERVADPRAGERERLRERAQHDDAVVDQPDRAVGAAVLPVGLVDDERPRARQRIERAGRIVRPAAERQHRIVVADASRPRAPRRRGRASTSARRRSPRRRRGRRTRARRAGSDRRRRRRARRSRARRRRTRRSRR